MTANKIVYAATAVIAAVACFKFLEHPTNRNLRVALLDILGLA